MKKFINLILLTITLGIILIPRFYQLGSTPPGLHIDEVSFAADAKALAETGRDTWNKRLPLAFQAFGEWKAPGLTYSMTFWSIILGRMDSFVSRLSSTVAGIFILIIYFFTLRTFYPKSPVWIALTSTVLLAFSPWHFSMSRIFYEAFSALAFIALACLYFFKGMLDPKYSQKYFIFGTIAAALAGYFYASVRYIVILAIISIQLFIPHQGKKIFKRTLAMLIVLTIVGAGWVGDLFSSRGLSRLRFYESKTEIGSALEIDEKRQYCGLNFGVGSILTQSCYYLWNKPVQKIFSLANVTLEYFSPINMFWHASPEYGIDAEYGYFLLPLLPLFLFGLYKLVIVISSVSQLNRVAKFIFMLILLSLAPPMLAGEINARFSLIALYLYSLIMGIGFHHFMTVIKLHLSRFIFLIISLLMTLSIIFFVLQSMMHYFAIFTKSNDFAWTSDSFEIFNYVKQVSKDYDLIIDTSLHGPLAPYFYGDLTTSEIQNSKRTPADSMGWTFIESAGKYQKRSGNIIDFACEKHGNQDKRKILVITPKVDSLVDIPRYVSRSWNKVVTMHEVYDLDEVVARELRVNPSFKTTCTAK